MSIAKSTGSRHLRAWLDSATATGQRHQRCSVSPRCNLVIPARASSVATGLLLLTVISADDGYATATVGLMQQISGRGISDGHLQRDREITRKFLYIYPDSAKIRKSPLPIGVEAILLHS
jgi:hypothetical protein